MKKRINLIVYIVMIVTGILGLLFYVNQPRISAPQEANQPSKKPKKTISVVVATRDLAANTILRKDDVQFKSVTVDADSDEVRLFNFSGKSLNNWALKNAVLAGSWILPDLMVEPGSNEYLALFLAPGNVLYTFELDKSDNYLLNNVEVGQGIDIYLSYRRVSLEQNETLEISAGQSRSNNQINNRLKPLMGNKRVLAIRPAVTVKKNGVSVTEKGSQLVVELQDREVKMLKGLGGDLANVVLFPAVTSPEGKTDITLPAAEMTWPVSDETIFDLPSVSPAMRVMDIKELRG